MTAVSMDGSRGARRRCAGRARGALAALAVGLCWLATAWPQAAVAQSKGCNPAKDLRCWYLVGGTGEAPGRVAFIARHVDPAIVDGRRRLEFVQVIEPAAHPEAFVIWDMEVDCGKSAFRIGRTRAGLRDGRVVDKPVADGGWQAFAGARYGEAFAQPFACKAGPIGEDDAIFLWNAYRAPDVVRLFRNVFWTDAAPLQRRR